jgi:hypothetical protein
MWLGNPFKKVTFQSSMQKFRERDDQEGKVQRKSLKMEKICFLNSQSLVRQELCEEGR